MDDDKAFEIIESPATRVPRDASRAVDGFTRQDVANAFAHAFKMIGGVQRLALWASAHPDKFYPLYSKLLPSQTINIGTSGDVIIQHALPPTDLDRHEPVQQGSTPAADAEG